jgi:hypothetical protein
MPRKISQLKSLEVRKQLLLAESEVNRAELIKEIDHVKGEFARVKKNIRTVGSIASTAALVATAVSVFHHRFNGSDNSNNTEHKSSSKVSWIAAALDGARMGASLFLKLKSMFRERE